MITSVTNGTIQRNPGFILPTYCPSRICRPCSYGWMITTPFAKIATMTSIRNMIINVSMNAMLCYLFNNNMYTFGVDNPDLLSRR